MNATQTSLRPYPIFTRDAEPLSEKIAYWLRSRIEAGVVRPGTRLPSVRGLAEDLKLSKGTIVEAYDRLVAQGYAIARRGAGFYVRTHSLSTDSKALKTRRRQLELPTEGGQLTQAMLQSMESQASPGSGLLPDDWMAHELVIKALKKIQTRHLKGYGDPLGYPPVREQLSYRLATHGVRAPSTQILITAGVTQALDVIIRSFTLPGDHVLVEEPGWFLLFAQIRALGRIPVGVARDEQGPIPEVLESLALRHQAHLFICNPELHNPSGLSLSLSRAHQLLKLASHLKLRIVEDMIYYELNPASQRGASLSSLDQLESCIYVGGFSKTLCASLRIGYLAANTKDFQIIRKNLLLQTMTLSIIPQVALSSIFETGVDRRHHENLINRVEQVRCSAIEKLDKAHLPLPHPDSKGPFLWLNFKKDTTVLASALWEKNILTAPGHLFNPDSHSSSYMRFNIAAIDDRLIKEIKNS